MERNWYKLSMFLATGLIICFLATIGYNIYISVSKEKVEVSTQISDSNYNHLEEK